MSNQPINDMQVNCPACGATPGKQHRCHGEPGTPGPQGVLDQKHDNILSKLPTWCECEEFGQSVAVPCAAGTCPTVQASYCRNCGSRFVGAPCWIGQRSCTNCTVSSSKVDE